jgi:hypothetical protein
VKRCETALSVQEIPLWQAYRLRADAYAAVEGLRTAGFVDAKIGVAPQADGAVVSVQADGRHAEAAAQMEGNGSSGVQNVAR